MGSDVPRELHCILMTISPASMFVQMNCMNGNRFTHEKSSINVVHSIAYLIIQKFHPTNTRNFCKMVRAMLEFNVDSYLRVNFALTFCDRRMII